MKQHTPSIVAFWSRVNPNGPTVSPELGECWVWTGGRGGSKYGQYGRLWTKRGSVYAHRFSWQMVNGSIPEGLQVCHHCDVPLCVKPSHMFLGTQRDNDIDRDRKNRVLYGESQPASKLTEVQAIEIREMRAAGFLLREIASRFGVSEATASLIVNGKSWRRASGPVAFADYRPTNRITNEEAQEARRLYAAGTMSQEAIGKKFGVAQTSISQIVLGKLHVNP